MGSARGTARQSEAIYERAEATRFTQETCTTTGVHLWRSHLAYGARLHATPPTDMTQEKRHCNFTWHRRERTFDDFRSQV